MSGTLPPELIDAIIDCLRGDRKSLRNCALTCHAWRARSRSNLFSVIDITTYASLMRLTPYSPIRPTYPFFHLLQELHLKDENTQKKRCLCHVALLQLSSVASTVKVLRLEAADWQAIMAHPIGHSYLRLSLSQYTTVTTLILDGCIFGNFLQFQQFILELPRLLHLDLSHSTIWLQERQNRSSLFTHTMSRTERPKLTHLDISYCKNDVSRTLLCWFCNTPTRRSLRDLALTSVVDPLLLHDILAQFSVLRALNIPLPCYRKLYGSHLAALPLIRFPHLQSLHWTMSITSLADLSAVEDAWRFTNWFLTRLLSPKLESHVLSLCGLDDPDFFANMHATCLQWHGPQCLWSSYAGCFREDGRYRATFIKRRDMYPAFKPMKPGLVAPLFEHLKNFKYRGYLYDHFLGSPVLLRHSTPLDAYPFTFRYTSSNGSEGGAHSGERRLSISRIPSPSFSVTT